jgi:hypothetical protein
MSDFLIGIITSFIASLIYLLFQFSFRYLGRKKYKYLLGDWYGYYLIIKDEIILEQKIEIHYSLFRKLKISIEEISASKYKYSGKLYILEDRLYANLNGIYHNAKSFIVMMLPLNRRDPLPSLNGIFSGITQDKEPASTKIHWSRSPKDKYDLLEEFGEGKNMIIFRKETKENILRKDIDNSIKQNR